MNLKQSSSPHIRGKDNTRRIMLDVIIALMPTLIVGTFVFTIRVLIITILSVGAAVLGEFAFSKITKRSNRIGDLSAVVTGLLLALTLPATVPYYIPVIGALFAVIVVKGIGGGIGQNTFNPALGARAFLLLFFPVWLVRYTEPFGRLPLGNIPAEDIITTATPLHHMQMPALPDITLLDMFIGRTPGCVGEVSAIAILIGGAYLVWRKVITLRIPLAYLGSVAIVSLVFSKGDSPLMWMAYSLLSGGLMLGAVFMATDYSSSPVEKNAQLVYGALCGVLTVVFRYFGIFPEGVTYAILIMNAASVLLDRIFIRRIYGKSGSKEVSQK